MAPFDRTQNHIDSLLLLAGCEQFLRRWRWANKVEQAFVPAAARSPPQLVSGHSHGYPVQPAFRVVAMRPRVPRPFHEHFDGDILRARGIPDHARYDASDALILRLEDRLDIKPDFARLHLNGFA